MIIFGQRLYGKVHHVPKLCYIATRFMHIQFVPLVPLESFLIFDGDSTRGVKLRMHLGSVLTAYLRGALIVIAIMAVIGAISHAGDREVGVLAPLFFVFVALVAVGAFIFTYYLNRRTHSDARDVLLRAGLDEDFVDGILAPPDLPAEEAFAGFSPGQQSYRVNTDPEQRQAAPEPRDIRQSQGGQGITSKPDADSPPDTGRDRFSTDTHP